MQTILLNIRKIALAFHERANVKGECSTPIYIHAYRYVGRRRVNMLYKFAWIFLSTSIVQWCVCNMNIYIQKPLETTTTFHIVYAIGYGCGC